MKVTWIFVLAHLGFAAGIIRFNGIIRLEGHAGIFRDGELRMTKANFDNFGGVIVDVGVGFLTTESGQRIGIDGGYIEAVTLPSMDRQALSNVLTRNGITLDQFLKVTDTNSHQNEVMEVLSGSYLINGVYYQIDIGVVFWEVLSAEVVESSGGTEPTVDQVVDQTQTIFVTDAHRTRTVVESVTLTQFSTYDVFVTVFAPLYNSIEATVTHFVKQTVNVPTDQVIRSPAAGNVVINTITVPSQRVMFVRDTKTNFYVQTVVGDAVSTLQHVVTNFAFQTVTIDIPATTSVIQTITQTSVATAYITTTVRSTIYTTSTVVISQGSATQTHRQGY